MKPQSPDLKVLKRKMMRVRFCLDEIPLSYNLSDSDAYVQLYKQIFTLVSCVDFVDG